MRAERDEAIEAAYVKALRVINELYKQAIADANLLEGTDRAAAHQLAEQNARIQRTNAAGNRIAAYRHKGLTPPRLRRRKK